MGQGRARRRSPAGVDQARCGLKKNDIVTTESNEARQSPHHNVRHGKFKYVHYVAYRPQRFDLDADPEELRDLAGDPGYAKVLEECRARLYAICDPAKVDARAKQRQAELLAAAGGREAVLERGDLGFTPPPGYPPVFG